MSERFECDHCGACCKGTLLVEADGLDFEREPKIKNCDPYYRDKSLDETRKLLADGMRVILLAAGGIRPCSLLDCENRCTIYPTRPNSCVGMQAGDEQCQSARQSMGLPQLEPVSDASH